jgi:putative membrane protein
MLLGIFIVLIIGFGIKEWIVDKELKKSNEYLEDPEAYMEGLKEKYEADSEEHAHEHGHGENEKPEEYYEELKNEWTGLEQLIVTEENYIPMMIVIDHYPDSFVGKRIELTGFVYREPEFSDEHIVIGRRGNPCCVEDEGIFGIISSASNASEFTDNQWVKVEGKLSKMNYFGVTVPHLIIEDIRKIEAPEDPFVYEPGE